MCKNHAGTSEFYRHHMLPAVKEERLEADKNGNDDDLCPICLFLVLKADRFPLGCSHVFCRPCIFECFRKKRSCPVCRAIPTEQEVDLDLTAPADGRVYDDTGLPTDWTEDDAIFGLVESLHVPSFNWEEPDLPSDFIIWRFPFW
jgi:hypothetical protein